MAIITTVNPYTQQVIAEYPVLTEAQIGQKLEQSAAAFSHWRQTPLSQRKALFEQLAHHLRQNVTALAALITAEMGKTLREAEGEVLKCADTIDYYLTNVEAFLADVPVKTAAQKSFVAYEPIGTVLAVMPWNFPFWQVLRFAIPSLLAGNVGLLKHASNVMGCGVALESIFRESGFPEGVFQNLIIGSDKVASVIKDSVVKAVTLTGSEPAGAAVASTAASVIKKAVLELGGSDPFVVLRDADLQKAAATAVKARFQNAGQTCIAAKRWIVEETVAEQFTEMVVNQTRRLHQGDPTLAATDMGPMAKPDLAKDLDKQLKKSVEKGAVLVEGGNHEQCNYEPTILLNVQPGMAAFDEETFGPLGCVIVAKDESAAIQLANQTTFGLGASVWTQDAERGEYFARQLQAGAVHVNSMVKSNAAMPFGGIKRSGFGRELAAVGMHEFMNVKSIWME